MPQFRIALAQVNSTVGDLAGNAQTIIEWTSRAAARGAGLVLFPEMMLTGYPVEDLALRASFVDASIAALGTTAARLAAEGLGGIPVVTGYLGRRAGLPPHTGQPSSAAQNAAALLHGGKVVVTTAIPPSPSAASRSATPCSAAIDASTNDARSARSSTG